MSAPYKSCSYAKLKSWAEKKPIIFLDLNSGQAQKKTSLVFLFEYEGHFKSYR